MQNTKIDIATKTRSSLCEMLNQHLANAIDLQTQCKQAHWNVRGPNFYSLHLLFDKVNEDVEDYVDLIAERIAQLGGQAYGTIPAVASTSALDTYPPDLVNSHGHVEALSHALATFGNAVRKAIDTTADMGDQGTSDMFTEISRGVDSWLWMVESHLLGGEGGDGAVPSHAKSESRLRATSGKK
jgi:starvation-inducible DNA-binding protein